MGQIDMNKHFESIVVAEQQVDDARLAVLAEYGAARANLRRRARSPAVIGGLLLGGIAFGYVALGRGKSNHHVYRESTDAWSRVIETTRVLLPLLVAIVAATTAARVPASNIAGPPR